MPHPRPRSSESPQTDPARRLFPSGVWGWALMGLVPLTSLAAATVSAWLVPPYLILIAGLLFGPALRSYGKARRTVGDPSERENAEGELVDQGEVAAVGSLAEGIEEPSTSAGNGVPPKPRKSRSRKPKPKADPGPVPSVVRVAWVQTGPGQFVRVEEAEPALVGPVLDEPSRPLGTDGESNDWTRTAPEEAGRVPVGEYSLDDGHGSEESGANREGSRVASIEETDSPEVVAWTPGNLGWDEEEDELVRDRRDSPNEAGEGCRFDARVEVSGPSSDPRACREDEFREGYGVGETGSAPSAPTMFPASDILTVNAPVNPIDASDDPPVGSRAFSRDRGGSGRNSRRARRTRNPRRFSATRPRARRRSRHLRRGSRASTARAPPGRGAGRAEGGVPPGFIRGSLAPPDASR